MALLALAILTLIVGVRVVAAIGAPDLVAETWKEHREACLQLPEEKLHHDRARAVRGVVHGPDGKPVSGALVQCIGLPSLLKLAQSSPPTPEPWSHLVQTQARTDPQGRFEFPHLVVGCRVFCASVPGLAPDVQSLILTQDGSGARIDFDLQESKKLRLQFKEANNRPRRVHLVPYRWWPELPSHDLAVGQGEVEFSGLGGPFARGLVVVSESDERPTWKPVAAFDLDRSASMTVSFASEYVVTVADVPEAASVHAWREGPSEASRLFFCTLTPVSLFWTPNSLPPQGGTGKSLLHAANWDARRETGGLRGYGSGPFMPVLIESQDGRSWLTWTSEASEFELPEVPAGVYRARTMNSFGRVSFARALVASPSEVGEFQSRIGEPIELDKPSSREVMGVVRWENGTPGDGAVVYLQDAFDFRRFLKRVVADKHGFYSIPGVPSGRYIAFALPPKEEYAMKPLLYPVVKPHPREAWLDFTLSPHRVVGQVPGSEPANHIDLVRLEPRGGVRIVCSVIPDQEGRFEITNVPHGQYYVVRVRGKTRTASDSFVVEREVVANVRWPQ